MRESTGRGRVRKMIKHCRESENKGEEVGEGEEWGGKAG